MNSGTAQREIGYLHVIVCFGGELRNGSRAHTDYASVPLLRVRIAADGRPERGFRLYAASHRPDFDTNRYIFPDG